MIRPLLEARAEIQKYFRSFLVQMKTLKFAFEIYWPLLYIGTQYTTQVSWQVWTTYVW